MENHLSTTTRPIVLGTKAKTTQLMSSDYVIYIRNFALSKGISAKQLIENTEADLSLLLTPPPKVSEAVLHQILFNFFNALSNPYIGVFEFGKGLVLSLHGNLGLAIQGASNLDEVIHLATQYFKTRANQRSLQRIDGTDYCEIRLSDEHVKYDYTLVSLLLSFGYIGSELLSHHQLDAPYSVHLQSSEPEDFPWHLVDNFTLKFNQPHHQIVIPKQWMTLPITPIDPEIANLAKDQCKKSLDEISPVDLVTEIQQRLQQSHDRNISLQEMATQLHTSPSTLQRRLKSFSTTFKNIKQDVRLAQAKRMLADKDVTIEHIAECLDFSDASNFSTFFKSFSGLSPSEYRKTQRND
ncbi:hypothetical protein A9Q99_12915 [Gammaproteobacteria bacterium 45_16_T64]|nr:hypothetical protein A9Q99_12915 [Gammaproteobacteria bacterium 45_16_T64]